MLLFIVDAGQPVHVAAGAAQGQNDAHGDGVPGQLMLHCFVFPDILVKHRLHCCRAHAVDHGATAHRQHKIHLLFQGQLCTCLHLRIPRIRRNTGKLDDFFSCCFQQADDLVIYTVAFDGSTAVSQQNAAADLRRHIAVAQERPHFLGGLVSDVSQPGIGPGVAAVEHHQLIAGIQHDVSGRSAGLHITAGQALTDGALPVPSVRKRIRCLPRLR